MSVKELNEKKLIALLPFQLLKLRKKIENLRTKENLEELQKFVINDIINSIYENEVVGNISHNDAMDLIELTTKLYMKIYSKYKELEDFTMRMCDQSLDFISDKYEETIDKYEEKVNKYEAQVDKLQGEVAGIKDMIESKDQIIKDLQRQLEELQKKE
jgi:hypothetical protein